MRLPRRYAPRNDHCQSFEANYFMLPLITKGTRMGYGYEARLGMQQSVMVIIDDAGIDARSSLKKKLEHPVSIDEPRYKFRPR